MNIQDQNSEILHLCSALNEVAGTEMFKVFFERNNSLDFISNSDNKNIAGLVMDINECLQYRLTYKHFALRDGLTGYCLPMDLVFKNFENNKLFQKMNLNWAKNRLYPSISHGSSAEVKNQIKKLSYNIQREVKNVLERVVLSPPLIAHFGTEEISYADLLNGIISLIVSENLVQDDGRIINSKKISRILFHTKPDFHIDDLLRVLHFHIRKVGTYGSFINY